MQLQDIYSKRILSSRNNTWDITTNEIYNYCMIEKINPYIFLAVYYIEGYFRPPWFQYLEYLLYKIYILKNPSVGPFQVRLSHFKDKNKQLITSNSLKFVGKQIKRSGLNKTENEANFIKFGYDYNLDKLYGKVLHKLFSSLVDIKWIKI